MPPRGAAAGEGRPSLLARAVFVFYLVTQNFPTKEALPLYRYVLIRKSPTPAVALLGEKVEFDPVNGGWVILRQHDGTSTSVPLSNVEGVYEVRR
jgi:hypothetical protein